MGDAGRVATACSAGTCIDRVNGFPGTCPSGGYLIVSPDVYEERREREVCGIAHATPTSETSCEGVFCGGAFSESSACKPVACQMPSHTKSCDGEFHHNEKTMFECLDGYCAGGTVGGAASFEVFCRADGFAVASEAGKPVSCGEPIFVGNTSVDIHSYLFSESMSYVCDTGYTTKEMASGDTTFTSSCQANGAFISPKSCKAVSCGVPEDDHGNLVPESEVFFFPVSARVTCQQISTTRSDET